VNNGRILGSPRRSQQGSLGFILVGKIRHSMSGHMGSSITRYPKLLVKGDKDVEKHWFLCDTIWRSRGNLDENKLVEFQTTLRGQTLKWYIEDIEPDCKEEPLPSTMCIINSFPSSRYLIQSNKISLSCERFNRERVSPHGSTVRSLRILLGYYCI
jgi:hypothetical protein